MRSLPRKAQLYLVAVCLIGFAAAVRACTDVVLQPKSQLWELLVFMALAMLGGALLQFPFGWLSDHFGRRPTMALMSAGGALVALFGYWADGQGDMTIYAAAALAGAMIFPMYAISAAHINDAVEPRNRVAAAAGLVLLFGLGSIFGPLAVGGVITGLGASGFYVVLAATLTASLAAAAVTR